MCSHNPPIKKKIHAAFESGEIRSKKLTQMYTNSKQTYTYAYTCSNRRIRLYKSSYDHISITKKINQINKPI